MAKMKCLVFEGIKFRYCEDFIMGKQFIRTFFWKNEWPVCMRHKINLNVAAHNDLLSLWSVFFLIVSMKTTV